jgi:acyl carrier protein
MVQDELHEIAPMLERFRRGETAITAETDLRLDLDLDSLAVMNFLMDVEDSFDVSIPLNALPELRTVGDLVRTIDGLKRRC